MLKFPAFRIETTIYAVHGLGLTLADRLKEWIRDPVILPETVDPTDMVTQA